MRTFLCPFFLVGSLVAQDMIGVSWLGSVYAIDSHAGTSLLLRAGTVYGHNASARDANGVIWTTQNPSGARSLAMVDPLTGATTPEWNGLPDIRGMASAGGTNLYLLTDGSPDNLQVFDTATGTLTMIGPTGSPNLQALAVHQGVLFAYDILAGLGTIAPATGQFTDLDPALPAPAGNLIQFLCSRSDGKLLGGRDSVYELDTTTGAETLLFTLGTRVDLRGMDEWRGELVPFGQACSATSGVPALSVTGALAPLHAASIVSDNHLPGAPGAQFLGTSNQHHGTLALPYDVDPLFGTSGCRLNVSIDIDGLSIVDAQGRLSHSFVVPPGLAGFRFYVQHVCIDTVPGNLSFSRGGQVTIAH